MTMKKYLMYGLAALAFASCNKFDIQSFSQEELVVKDYSAKFINSFGQPAANQDWGFGTGTTKGITRTIQPSFNFPADADASKFLAAVPDGVEKLTQNVGRANHYIDETWQGELNIWGAATAEGNWQDRCGGTLYIKGNCDFSNRKFYFDGHSELYLLEGATLTLNAENAANLQTYTNIYMAANSKIVTSAELKLNNGLHIFNHGTIEAAKLSTNSDSWLVNGGTVTISGKISVENTLSVIENNGTITAADLNTAGSGKFENNADVTITGTTFINSNDNTWVNNGQYHTGNFIYNAASDEVINNCRLTVDEDFNINLGDNPGNGNFKMDAGSGVVTKNFNGGGNWAKNYSTGWSSFNGGPFYIYMGAGSLFKVTETATMNATKANYGIYGPETGDYAVFQAKNIVAGAANQGYEVTYGGNLYAYAEESHFAQGYSGSYPFIDFKGNAKVYAPGFEDGKPNVTIPTTTCNPGFIGGEAISYQGRIMAEDLTVASASDWDFNDVVFDWAIKDGKAYIKLLAAGGQLSLTIGGELNDEKTEVVGGVEIHEKFGVATSVMVNTGLATADPVEFVLNDGKTYTKPDEIKLYVKKSGIWMEITAEQAKPAGKFNCKVGTKWCDEYVNIKRVYPLFAEWVINTEVDWAILEEDKEYLVDKILNNNL